MNIRVAKPEDAKKLVEIYSYYVKETAVSFEHVVPTEEEFGNRIVNTLKEYPYLVAEEDDEIIGYVYASQFHSRIAYKHCAELSIYLDHNKRRNGVGRALYNEIERILLKQNIVSLHACIAVPDDDLNYVTSDSELFHSKMGFEKVGTHSRCGYKFNRWFSIIWMDKDIAPKTSDIEPFIEFNKLSI